VGELHATESGRLVVIDSAVERKLVTTPQDHGDTAGLIEHSLRSLADPSQPLIESPGAFYVGVTQGDQVDPLLYRPKLPRHEETNWKPGRGAQLQASCARIVLPKSGRSVGVPGADRYRPVGYRPP
jgi:hypothetical protein